MKLRTALIAVAVVSLLWTAAASAEIKEGLWEITTRTEMKGMANAMPATTVKTCITKKDMVPKPGEQGPAQGQDCKTKDQKIAGDTVTYSMECTAKDGTVMEMSGKMAYRGDVFDGSSSMTMKSKGQGPMQMSSKMTGKYVGACTK